LKREIAQERESDSRDGEISRGLRAVRQRLLEEQSRLREICLRRNPFAITNLVDGVRALRLIGCSATRVPCGLSFLQ
jgi:hypothetical protein